MQSMAQETADVLPATHWLFCVLRFFFPIVKCITVFSYDYIVHSNVKMSPSPARKSKCTFPVERWLKMGDCNRE